MKTLIKRFKENASIVNENKLLELKIRELENIIDESIERRQEDFIELKRYFRREIDEKVDEIKSSMQLVIDNKNKEIQKLANIIKENKDIVQAIKNQNTEIQQLGDESVHRLKLANDFFQKGVQQMERIFSEFDSNKRRFKEIEKEKLPNLQENMESQILIRSKEE